MKKMDVEDIVEENIKASCPVRGYLVMLEKMN